MAFVIHWWANCVCVCIFINILMGKPIGYCIGSPSYTTMTNHHSIILIKLFYFVPNGQYQFLHVSSFLWFTGELYMGRAPPYHKHLILHSTLQYLNLRRFNRNSKSPTTWCPLGHILMKILYITKCVYSSLTKVVIFVPGLKEKKEMTLNLLCKYCHGWTFL